MSRRHRDEIAVIVWAVAGVVFLFGEAAWRLGLRGAATIRGGLTSFEWLALILLTAAFVYGEGVRALQRRWVPYVLTRIERLRTEPSVFYRLAAPLYTMALVGPTTATVVRAWAGVAAIILAVLIVSRFPEPWRGIVDIAVASALVWGALALMRGAVRTFRSHGTGS